ncbi:hypothetical protein [Streptomyces capparidis]
MFRRARYAGAVPAPDATARQWSRAAVEAMDPAAIRAAMSHAPIPGAVAADRIAAAASTPNQPGQAAAVTVFVVPRLIGRGLLTDLSGNPDGVLPEQHPENDFTWLRALRKGQRSRSPPWAPRAPPAA